MKKLVILVIMSFIISFVFSPQLFAGQEATQSFVIDSDKIFVKDVEDYEKKLIAFYKTKTGLTTYENLLVVDKKKKLYDFLLDELNAININIEHCPFTLSKVKVIEKLSDFIIYLPPKEQIQLYKIISLARAYHSADEDLQVHYEKYYDKIVRIIMKHYVSESNPKNLYIGYQALAEIDVSAHRNINKKFEKITIPFVIKVIDILNKKGNIKLYNEYNNKELIRVIIDDFNNLLRSELDTLQRRALIDRKVYEKLFYKCVDSYSPQLILWGLKNLIRINQKNYYSKKYDYSVYELDLILQKAIRYSKNYSEKYALKKDFQTLADALPDNYFAVITKHYNQCFGIHLSLKNNQTVSINSSQDNRWEATNFKVGKKISYLKGFNADLIFPAYSDEKFVYAVEYSRFKKFSDNTPQVQVINVQKGALNEKCCYFTRLIKIDPINGIIKYGKKFLVPHDIFFKKSFQYIYNNNLVVFSKKGFIYYDIDLQNITLDKAPCDFDNEYSMVEKDNKLYIFKRMLPPQQLISYDLMKQKYENLFQQNYETSDYQNIPFLKFCGFDKNNQYLLFKNLDNQALKFDLASNKLESISTMLFNNISNYNSNREMRRALWTKNYTFIKTVKQNLNPHIFDSVVRSEFIRYNDASKIYHYRPLCDTDSQHMLFIKLNNKKNRNNLKNSLFILTNIDQCPINYDDILIEDEIISSCYSDL
ncbi:hypothetical protein AAEX28_05310 [Lentisphaerota bacterium WC36G]|nr:hypothetical protein LJT99_08165 [Lentisphaerae bacterium WC36]